MFAVAKGIYILRDGLVSLQNSGVWRTAVQSVLAKAKVFAGQSCGYCGID
jgi:hypothetical protein